MNNEKEKTLLRAKEYINKYKGDDSIYYKQLKVSYQEYKELDSDDQATNELYIKHLNELCNYITERRNANLIITLLIIFSVFIIGLSSYTTYKYFNLSENLKENILKHNGSTSINVHFNNSSGFNANKLSDIESYMNLEPLSFTILATNKISDNVKVHYDVYLIEQNDDLLERDKITKDAFLYNVNSSNKESGVKALKNATKKNDRLLIFSGETVTNVEENIELRMWIDSNTDIDYINKKYRFKIYVDGYVV